MRLRFPRQIKVNIKRCFYRRRGFRFAPLINGEYPLIIKMYQLDILNYRRFLKLKIIFNPHNETSKKVHGENPGQQEKFMGRTVCWERLISICLLSLIRVHFHIITQQQKVLKIATTSKQEDTLTHGKKVHADFRYHLNLYWVHFSSYLIRTWFFNICLLIWSKKIRAAEKK